MTTSDTKNFRPLSGS